jgi:isopenicillin N synthase-like dioxygenase
MAKLSVYATNRWPDQPVDFAPKIQSYFKKSLSISMVLLRAIAAATERDATYFDDKFSKPMALLRGNYYPPRPLDAGALDFGIAAHSD